MAPARRLAATVSATASSSDVNARIGGALGSANAGASGAGRSAGFKRSTGRSGRATAASAGWGGPAGRLARRIGCPARLATAFASRLSAGDTRGSGATPRTARSSMIALAKPKRCFAFRCACGDAPPWMRHTVPPRIAKRPHGSPSRCRRAVHRRGWLRRCSYINAFMALAFLGWSLIVPPVSSDPLAKARGAGFVSGAWVFHGASAFAVPTNTVSVGGRK